MEYIFLYLDSNSFPNISLRMCFHVNDWCSDLRGLLLLILFFQGRTIEEIINWEKFILFFLFFQVTFMSVASSFASGRACISSHWSLSDTQWNTDVPVVTLSLVLTAFLPLLIYMKILSQSIDLCKLKTDTQCLVTGRKMHWKHENAHFTVTSWSTDLWFTLCYISFGHQHLSARAKSSNKALKSLCLQSNLLLPICSPAISPLQKRNF